MNYGNAPKKPTPYMGTTGFTEQVDLWDFRPTQYVQPNRPVTQNTPFGEMTVSNI